MGWTEDHYEDDWDPRVPGEPGLNDDIPPWFPYAIALAVLIGFILAIAIGDNIVVPK